ncbi:MAG: helix-turn-helix domain-containing protein [Methylocella sp.]
MHPQTTTTDSSTSAAAQGDRVANILPLSHGGAYTVFDAAKLIGVSRSSIFNLIAAKKLRTLRIAGRRLIPADAIRALISGGE